MNHDAVRRTLYQADVATVDAINAALDRLDALLATATGELDDDATIQARALVEHLHVARSQNQDNRGMWTWYVTARAQLGNPVKGMNA